MAYDEDMADRVREVVYGLPGLHEKKMFGGLAWMLDGNMVVAMGGGGDLLVRVGKEGYEAALAEPGAAEAVMGSRVMRGWVEIPKSACEDPSDLAAWVGRGVAYARSLEPK